MAAAAGLPPRPRFAAGGVASTASSTFAGDSGFAGDFFSGDFDGDFVRAGDFASSAGRFFP